MEKKKNVKKFIALFFVFLIFSIAVVCFFIFKPNSESQQTKEYKYHTRYALAQNAIFNEISSQNYNGTYKFSRVIFINMEIYDENYRSKIFNYYNVSSTLSLISKLTNIKSSQNKNELLNINNNHYNFSKNSSIVLSGNVYGNDDLSNLYDKQHKKIYSITLTNIFNENLKDITETEIKYYGTKLFLIETISINIDDKDYNFDIVCSYISQ